MKSIRMMLLIFITVFFITSCDDGCEPEELRCSDNTLEICDTGDNWRIHTVCTDLFDLFDPDLKTWSCCFSNELNDYSCVKEECQ